MYMCYYNIYCLLNDLDEFRDFKGFDDFDDFEGLDDFEYNNSH